MKIKKMLETERPYEKLELEGESFLSNAELMSIIIKTGTKKESSLEIAHNLMMSVEGNIRNVFYMELDELKKIAGIGRVKAIQIKAVGELIRRVEVPIRKNDTAIKSGTDIVNRVMPQMRYLNKEQLRLILLDAKGYIREVKKYSTEGINSISIEPINILKHAIKKEKNRIIIVHNHPSGDPRPSPEDISYTKDLIRLGKTFEIEVLDHIIIGDGSYDTVMKYIHD